MEDPRESVSNDEKRGFLEPYLGDLLAPGLSPAEMEQIAANVAEHLPEIVKKAGSGLAEKLQATSESMLRSRRQSLEVFREQLMRVWGTAIDQLETCIVLSSEAGEMLVEKMKAEQGQKQGHDYRFEALARIHARACQVATEISELLKAGFADGAHARWRTLHELAVTSLFLLEGDDVLSERYLAYRPVQSFRDAAEYQKQAKLLGYEPFSDAEMNTIRLERDATLKLYGGAFGKSYGWAAEALGVLRPTFSKIETCVGLDHLRPYYKMASQNVHSGPESLVFRLGNPPREPQALLVGPSNVGLADPGQSTAFSLNQVTRAFLLISPTFQTLAVVHVMNEFVGAVRGKFIAAEFELEREAD